MGVGVHPTFWKITWSDSSAVQRDHILWFQIERNLGISSSMYVLSLNDQETPEKDKAENQFCHHLWALGCPYIKNGPAFCGKKNCTDSETLPETTCPLHPKKGSKSAMQRPCAIYFQVLILSSSNINKGGFLFLKIIQNLPACPCDGLQLGETYTSLRDMVNANQ